MMLVFSCRRKRSSSKKYYLSSRQHKTPQSSNNTTQDTKIMSVEIYLYIIYRGRLVGESGERGDEEEDLFDFIFSLLIAGNGTAQNI